MHDLIIPETVAFWILGFSFNPSHQAESFARFDIVLPNDRNVGFAALKPIENRGCEFPVCSRIEGYFILSARYASRQGNHQKTAVEKCKPRSVLFSPG
jgi:hypothetical protein